MLIILCKNAKKSAIFDEKSVFFLRKILCDTAVRRAVFSRYSKPEVDFLRRSRLVGIFKIGETGAEWQKGT